MPSKYLLGFFTPGSMVGRAEEIAHVGFVTERQEPCVQPHKGSDATADRETGIQGLADEAPLTRFSYCDLLLGNVGRGDTTMALITTCLR